MPELGFPVLIAAALLPVAMPGAPGKPQLPPYADALPCAALTHAAMQIGKGGPDEAKLFDHLIFWGMASAEAGRAAGKTEKQVDAEVRAQSALDEAKLRADDAATKDALAACVAKVPPLTDDDESDAQ